MRLCPFAIAFVLLAPAAASAQDPRLAFLKGNEAMERQAWDEAASAYRSVLASGAESGEVHFNLANAEFRGGRIGPAILHYRKAREILPRDPDIAWNLEIARGAVQDQVARREPPEILRTLLWLHFSTSAREARAVAFALFLLGMTLLHVRLFARRPALTRIAIVLLALAAIGAVSLVVRECRVPEAVVLPAELVVRSGPGASYAEHMKLHEGVEARIEEERGGWLKLDIDGKKGWVPAEAVGRL